MARAYVFGMYLGGDEQRCIYKERFTQPPACLQPTRTIAAAAYTPVGDYGRTAASDSQFSAKEGWYFTIGSR